MAGYHAVCAERGLADLLQIENAGGESSCDGKCVSGLDVEIKEWDQRTQICYGSKGEVRRFEEYLYGESERFAEAEVA